MMGSDIGISVGASVALNFGASAGVGVLCSMSFAGSKITVCRVAQYLGSLLVLV